MQIGNREHSFEDSVSSINDVSSSAASTPSISTTSLLDVAHAHHSIDILFERSQDTSVWEPPRPPKVLGELLDSRYMLPLSLPSDPRLLSALPGKRSSILDHSPGDQPDVGARSSSRTSVRSRSAMAWRLRNRKLREVSVDLLQWVDGVRSAARWRTPVDLDDKEDSEDENEGRRSSFPSDDLHLYTDEVKLGSSSIPLTRKPSAHKRPSIGGETIPTERL